MRIRFRIRSLLLAVAVLALALVLAQTWVYPPGVNLNMRRPNVFEVQGDSVTPENVSEVLARHAERLDGSHPRLLRIYVAEEAGFSPDEVNRALEIGREAGFESFAVDYYTDGFLGSIDF